MASPDFSLLDSPDISLNSFYPSPNWNRTPPGAEDHTVEGDQGVTHSSRFFPAGRDYPTILFFYGHGETAADYNSIAPLYNQVGANVLVADYRGYGGSGGSPRFSTMLSDAHKVLEMLRSNLESEGYVGAVYVMGRSMGRHPAFELAANAKEKIRGLIVESGRASLGQFVHGLDVLEAQRLEAAYQDKVQGIDIPVLVIHGEMDTLVPVQEAVGMCERFASANKRLVTIPGSGHNDLLDLGITQYFGAIRDFVSP